MTQFQSLSAAGFLATAISYGPARMGFGLFVPVFREDFALTTASVGFISGAAFAGFLAGLLVAQSLLNRRGPEVPVLTGLGAATLGLGLVTTAATATQLALGVILAASSAGFAWTPFNDAVHRKIRQVDRPTALSEISTGTSIGIAGAGGAALLFSLTQMDWRVCWALFAGAAALAWCANWAALRKVEKSPGPGPDARWRDLLHRRAVPLYAVACVFGTTSAIFLTFAPARFEASNPLPQLPEGSEPALLFMAFGLSGLLGLMTGQLRDRIGLSALLRGLMTAAAISLGAAALLPGVAAGLFLAASLQGVNVMMTSAVMAFWSESLFPGFPSLGFTSALLAMATGSVLGPALGGLVATAAGGTALFIGTAALPLAMALVIHRRIISERPANRPLD